MSFTVPVPDGARSLEMLGVREVELMRGRETKMGAKTAGSVTCQRDLRLSCLDFLLSFARSLSPHSVYNSKHDATSLLILEMGYPVAINAHLLSLYSQFADTPQGPNV
jgi:hypothetical protein